MTQAIPFPYESPRNDLESLKQSIANKLIFTVGKNASAARPEDWMHAAAFAVRDRLVERWMRTTHAQYDQDAKRVYYMSMEFLMGRAFDNAMLALELRDDLRQALSELGADIDVLASLRTRRRAGQRRPGPPRRLLPRRHGHAGHSRLRIRHSLRLRHVPPDHRRRPASRGARLLAHPRQPLGIRTARGRLQSAVRRPRGQGRHATPLGRHPQRARHGLRHHRARLRHRGHQHAATLVRQGHRGNRPWCLQQRQLFRRRRKQEPFGKRLARALPRRLHAVGPRAAPAPGILLRQRQRARLAAPLPQDPRQL